MAALASAFLLVLALALVALACPGGASHFLQPQTRCVAFQSSWNSSEVTCSMNPLLWTQAPYSPSSLLFRYLRLLGHRFVRCWQHQTVEDCVLDVAHRCQPNMVTMREGRAQFRCYPWRGAQDWSSDAGLQMLGPVFSCHGSLGQQYHQCRGILQALDFSCTSALDPQCTPPSPSSFIRQPQYVPLVDPYRLCQAAGCTASPGLSLDSPGSCLPAILANATPEEVARFLVQLLRFEAEAVGTCALAVGFSTVKPHLNAPSSFLECNSGLLAHLAYYEPASGWCLYQPTRAPASLDDIVWGYLKTAAQRCTALTLSARHCEEPVSDPIFGVLDNPYFVFAPDVVDLLAGNLTADVEALFGSGPALVAGLSGRMHGR